MYRLVFVLTMCMTLAACANAPAPRNTLPPDFSAIPEAGLDRSGWPNRIRSLKDNSIMVFIPAGEFQSGLDDRQRQHLFAVALMRERLNREQLQKIAGVSLPDDELQKTMREAINKDFPPPQKIRTAAFYIDICEVTNRQYRAFFDAVRDPDRRPGFRGGGESNPHNLWDYPQRSHDQQPVTFVREQDMLAYATWAAKEIPTRIQWERAARGDGDRLFPWGSDWAEGYCALTPIFSLPYDSVDQSRALSDPLDFMKMMIPAGINRPEPAKVGQFPHDISPFGCLDMAGNVSEWVRNPSGDGTKGFPMGGNVSQSRLDSLCPARKQAEPDSPWLLGFRTILRVH